MFGCASQQNKDPLEGLNRTVYKFNDVVDKVALKPVAQGYQAITPSPVQTGVNNFFKNIRDVVTIVNELFQFKFKQAANTTGRVALNTTVGVLGIFDVHSKAGGVRTREDFGQTFGKWGASSGAYVMLPFLGPSSIRDALAKPLDMLVNPRNLLDHASANMALVGLQVVDTRADLIPFEKIIEGDEYLFLRDVYLQRREFLVQDGKVKDSFMDDMDEESNQASQ